MAMRHMITLGVCSHQNVQASSVLYQYLLDFLKATCCSLSHHHVSEFLVISRVGQGWFLSLAKTWHNNLQSQGMI